MEFITMLEFILANPKYVWAIFSLLMMLVTLFSFIKAHLSKSHPFDIFKLFLYDSNGKLSDSKARLNGAFVVTSWAFIYLTMNNLLTEWYVGVFLLAWVGDRAASRIEKAKQNIQKETTKE